MSEPTKTICLGTEHDDRLREALVAVLRSMGAVVLDGEPFWGLGGSQEVTIVHVEIGGRSLSIEAETYIGLSVVGEAGLVDEIARQVGARTAAGLDRFDAALPAVIDGYLTDACPCRFPRFRAVVSLDTSPDVGSSLTTREQRSLIAAFDAKVPIADRAPFGPPPDGRQGSCGICGSRVERTSSEDGVQFLVIRAASGLVDFGAPIENGQIFRATAFEPVGRGSGGAGKVAMRYPRIAEDEFLRWLRARRE